MNNKIKILVVTLVVGLDLLWFLKTSSLIPGVQKDQLEQKENAATTQNESPRIISTKPDPLEGAIVSANETIEITFNRSLENAGEFKVRLETKKDFKVELSPDRKTAKIIPFKPYELGTTYTLFIGPDTKFDGIGRWGEEKIYHFRTIQYRGV